MSNRVSVSEQQRQLASELSIEVFKPVTGSDNVPFSVDLIRRTLSTIYEVGDDQQSAIIACGAAMKALAPSDEVEGLLAAQIVAAHYASLACFQRAKTSQHPEYAARYRRDAANLSRCMIDMLDSLARKRGHVSKQVVRVEKVVVHEGAQAIVGAITGGGSK